MTKTQQKKMKMKTENLKIKPHYSQSITNDSMHYYSM